MKVLARLFRDRAPLRIEDVPCGACVHHYADQHVCDVPAFCPCDNWRLHL